MRDRTDARVFRFRGFTLDLGRGTLARSGLAVTVRPKSFRLLSYLAAHAGKVISKSELMDAVWPNVAVTEDSLTQCIRDIRLVLGDEGRQLVRTVARRGYLFDAEFTLPGAGDTGDLPTVAVLPFRNDSHDAERDVFTDGMVEEIINGLARFRTVTVLARNSSFTFRPDARPDFKTVGERLGARYLVDGSVCRKNGQLVVMVHLVEAARGAQLWSDRFAAAESDVFAVLDTIARKIISRLVARLEEAGLQWSARNPTASLEAYDLLLRGVALLRGYGPGNNEEASRLFEQALAIDPAYGLAHSYLALSQVVLHGYAFAPAAVLAEASELAVKGISLAPEDARCHRILAQVRLFMREHEAAEHHLRHSLDLNPYDADTVAQMGYLLTLRGRPKEGMAWMDKAAWLNPIHPDWYHFDRAMALYSIRDYSAAAKSLERLPRLGPWALARLAACYGQLGEIDKARDLLERAFRLRPGFSPIDYARTGVAFENSEDIDHVVEGLSRGLGVHSSA